MAKPKTTQNTIYNEREYARYTLRIRKDSDLNDTIESFMSRNGTSLNFLVTKLLREHFHLADILSDIDD
jgi:hypothetical protein